jgi:hypothetical protein
MLFLSDFHFLSAILTEIESEREIQSNREGERDSEENRDESDVNSDGEIDSESEFEQSEDETLRNVNRFVEIEYERSIIKT